MEKRNHALVVDYYSLNMAQALFKLGDHEKNVVFEVFFRRLPHRGGFGVAAGFSTFLKGFENCVFDEDRIEFLKTKGFDDEFLDYIKNRKFLINMRAVREGTIVFPNEPLALLSGNILDIILFEGYLLECVNHGSSIATLARRMKMSAGESPIIEMGTRRAFGIDASVEGAKYAYIGGVSSTSNVEADYEYGVKSLGTMAHLFVQLYGSDESAFKKWADAHLMMNTNKISLLLDTFDVKGSGLPFAIETFKYVKEKFGSVEGSVRLDSGDLGYLSKCVRKTLDAEGFESVKIIVSNSLDEYVIKSLKEQEAPIDVFGVGEKLITCANDPVFGAVMKMVEVEGEGRIKFSEDTVKITNPMNKNLYRVYDSNGYMCADLMTLKSESKSSLINERYIKIYEQSFPYRAKEVYRPELEDMLFDVIVRGNVDKDLFDKYYNSVDTAKSYVEYQMNCMWEELKRFENPAKYFVDMSKDLVEIKKSMLDEYVK